MKRWIEIDGAFLVDVKIDEFSKQLMEWLTSKEWYFAGVTQESDAPVPEGLDEEDTTVEQAIINPDKKMQH